MIASPAVRPRRRRWERLLILLGGSAATSLLAAALILWRHRALAGLAALASGAALVTVAAAGAAEREPRIRLAELALDRIFDAVVLLPLAWVERSGSNHEAALALVGFGASYLASYQRARGRSLGYAGAEGIGYRLTRYALLSLGLLFGLVEAALWLFAGVAVAAALVRAWGVVHQERRLSRPRSSMG